MFFSNGLFYGKTQEKKNMKLASQIIVTISDILFVMSMLSKKKTHLLIFLCVSDITFALHYFLLQANSGAWVFIVDSIYLIAIFLLEHYHKENFKLLVTLLSVALVIICCTLSWQSWVSILPMVAMATSLICSCFKNVVIVKSGAFVRNILNLIYMLVIPNKSLIGAILQGVLIIISFIGIIQSVKFKKQMVEEQPK